MLRVSRRQSPLLQTPGVFWTLSALCMFTFVAVAGAQETPGEELQEAQSEATEEFQSQADDAPEAIGQQAEQQQDQIDQQLDQQQDQIEQQLDQATDQAQQQQDTLNQQLDQAEDQADLQEQEINDQLTQDEQQLDRQEGIELEGETAIDQQAEGQVNLGVTVDEQTETREGLTVGEILSGSAAAEAGLRRGDVIMSIDGQPVTTASQLDQFLSGRSVGDAVDFIVLRNGRRQPMTVTFRQSHFHPQSRQAQYGPDYRQTRQHGWLGVTLQSDNDPFGQGGAGIASVVANGPAARAGLTRGDRILAIDNQRVSSVDQVLNLLSRTSPGDRIQLRVLSNGRERSFDAVLADGTIFQGGAQGGISYQQSGYPSGYQGSEGYTPAGYGDSSGSSHDMLRDQHQQLVEQQQRIEGMLQQIQRDLAAIQRQLDMQSGSRTYEDGEIGQQYELDSETDSSRTTARPVAPEEEVDEATSAPERDAPTDNPRIPN